MDEIDSSQLTIERLRMDNCDEEKIMKNKSSNRVLQAGLSLLLIATLPDSVVSSDYDCGINRFNNESPLTERIVGGNNSLQ